MPTNTWMAVIAAFFGFVTQSLSTDGGGSVLQRLGLTWAIPKGLVFPLVLLFGLAAGVFESVLHGLSWSDAAAQGVTAMLTALFGVLGSQHLTGRDAEGHSKPVTPPKVDSGSPPIAPVLGLIVAGYLFANLVACGLFTPANLPKTELAAEQIACILEHAFLDDPAMNAVCKLLTPAQQAAAKAVAAAHRAQLGREMKALRAESCDAGVEAGK